jgi:hypothetical protein
VRVVLYSGSVLNANFLRNAQRAAVDLASRQREVRAAEARYFLAIRQLHADGGAIGEIADFTGLSRRRIRRVVQTAAPGKRRRRGGGGMLTCSFCGKEERTVRRLIAGPGVYICNGCVASARAQGLSEQTGEQCSFCLRQGPPIWRLGPPRKRQTRICDACLDNCDAVLAREPPG